MKLTSPTKRFFCDRKIQSLKSTIILHLPYIHVEDFFGPGKNAEFYIIGLHKKQDELDEKSEED